MAGGIALSESFGTILAPDERRLGARVSQERLRWVFSHRVKVHTGRDPHWEGDPSPTTPARGLWRR
ncbi:MAG: hypothetical protein RXP91_06605 [Nitrososphaeria archaeon]